MTLDIVSLVLAIVATLTGGVLVLLSYTYHRQQALQYWEREKRLPDATRYENLKFLSEQEEAKLRELRDQLFDANQTIEKADELKRWMAATKEEIERLQADRLEVERVQAQLESLQRQLAEHHQLKLELEAQCAERKQALDELVAQTNKLRREAEELSELTSKLSAVRQELVDLERRKHELGLEIERMRSDAEIAKNRALDELHRLEREHQSLTQQAASLRDEINKQSEQLKQAKDELAKSKAGLEHELDELRRQLAHLQKERDKAAQDAREKTSLLAELKGQIEAHDGSAKSATDLWVPVFASPRAGNDWQSEGEALDSLKSHLAHHGLRFHERTLYAFHTSLKTTQSSPLVVLAGVSGTGKSLLPRRYAESMGMNFLNVAVQPRWDSPQDLFGFYDYMEQRYRPTELTRALIQMDRYWDKEDRGWQREKKELQVASRGNEMLLVLLDEMNLARVEYYFSEFLSRLETRREIKDAKDSQQRQSAEISLDVGGRRGVQPMRLFVDGNVIFVGTMNEDETTQALSDKVIDRSNVLRFGSPASLERLSGSSNGKALKEGKPRLLPYDTWKTNWLKNSDALSRESLQLLEDWIAKLRSAMDQINRPFAYRVAKGMLEYAANYPDPNAHIGRIISDQIEQKILPRLRGIDPTDGRGKLVFTEIQKILRDPKCNDELLDSHLAGLLHDNFFQWAGLDRAKEAAVNA